MIALLSRRFVIYGISTSYSSSFMFDSEVCCRPIDYVCFFLARCASVWGLFFQGSPFLAEASVLEAVCQGSEPCALLDVMERRLWLFVLGRRDRSFFRSGVGIAAGMWGAEMAAGLLTRFFSFLRFRSGAVLSGPGAGLGSWAALPGMVARGALRGRFAGRVRAAG